MARRLVLAALLALAGLCLLAFADLPPGRMGMPYRHVPVQARITDRTEDRLGSSDATAVSHFRLHYAFEGRSYDGSYAASNRIPLPSGDRRFGDLRSGDTLEIWIDPARPDLFPSPRRDQRLGNEPGKILLGLALLIASVIVAIAGRVRPAAVRAP